MTRLTITLSMLVLGLGVTARAQSSSTISPAPQAFTDDTWKLHISPEAGIANPEDARAVIESTLGKMFPHDIDVRSRSFTCLVHVVKFTDPKLDMQSGNYKQSPAAQNWYVVGATGSSTADFRGKRIYGVARPWLLYIHLNVIKSNVDSKLYHPRYVVQVTQKTAANISHLNDLLGLYNLQESGATDTTDVWGGGVVGVDTTPADVSVTAKLLLGDSETTLADPQVFNDEGLYWWDVSVGIPIRSMKQLTVDTNAGTATPTTIEKNTAFAVLDIYLRPVDVTTGLGSRLPHAVIGVSFDSKPLDRVLIGGAWGPYLADFYIGAVLVQQDKAGGGKTMDVQFGFGVNVSVKAAAAALKKVGKQS